MDKIRTFLGRFVAVTPADEPSMSSAAADERREWRARQITVLQDEITRLQHEIAELSHQDPAIGGPRMARLEADLTRTQEELSRIHARV